MIVCRWLTDCCLVVAKTKADVKVCSPKTEIYLKLSERNRLKSGSTRDLPILGRLQPSWLPQGQQAEEAGTERAGCGDERALTHLLTHQLVKQPGQKDNVFHICNK